MAFTETTTTGYGTRLGNSLKGIVTGFVLFIIGTCILFWNEGNFVKTKKAINEGQNVVLPLSDVSKVDPRAQGKLIHATALADTKDTLRDDLFSVKAVAIALDRKAEYYQWVEKSKTEKKDKIGGGQEEKTTYTYQQEWTSQVVNSSDFKDPQYQNKNFVRITVENQHQLAEQVSFGGYKLPHFIISSVSGSEAVALDVSDDRKKEWESAIGKNLVNQDILIGSKDSTQREPSLFHVQGNTAYIGESPSQPQVGDVRVTFTKVKPAIISILAKVNGDTFEPYLAKNGKNISQVAQGTVSADHMFEGAHASNSTWTWVLRVVGLILVVIGLKSMFSIIESLFKVLPLLSDIVGAGVGLVISIVGFAWALLIVSISWLFYRPLIAVVLIAVVVGMLVYLKKRAKDKRLSIANETVPAMEG